MIPAMVLIPVLLITVTILILAEFSEKRKIIFIVKPLSTILVIGVAVLSFFQPEFNLLYSIGILVGLLFSFGGDVALMFQKNQRAFAIGLRLFLLAHVAYIIVFAIQGVFSGWDILSAGILLISALFIYRLFRKNLGTMKIPVIIYLMIISIMVNRAGSVIASPIISSTQSLLILIGAVLFYISDVILAMNRFWKSWKYNRISLAFYYSGQLLIALAAHYFTTVPR